MPLDTEIIGHFRLEAPSAIEQEWMDRIEPTEFGIYTTRVELGTYEAKQVLVDMGVSVVIQSGDCIVGVYTREGDLAIGTAGTYLHVITGQIPIKYIIKHFIDDPDVGVRDGDIFFCNEAIYGGIHNCDQINVVPIFHEGELIAWSVAAGHEPETGAIDPGGMPPAAKTRWEEGIKVPPVKIGENFKLKPDVVEMITNNVRDVRMIGNDMRARSAAALKLRERVLELAEKKGPGFVQGLLRKIAGAAADGARKKIAMLHDGVYRHVIFFDTAGYTLGLGRMAVEVTVKGDSAKVDFNGTSPVTPSFFNAFPHIVRSHLMGDLCQYLFGDLPASTGLLEPFEITAPPGSCLNAPLETAISGGVRICPIAVNAAHQCFNKAMFGTELRQFVANPLGAGGRGILYGVINQYGKIVADAKIDVYNASGGGARPHLDGVDGTGFPWSGYADALDVEQDEVQVPFLHIYRSLGMDVGGPGRQRGGAGLAECFVLHNTPFHQSIWMGLNQKIPADPGIFGGYAGGLCPVLAIRHSDWFDHLSRADQDIPYSYHDQVLEKTINGVYQFDPGEISGAPMASGDSISVISTGGGGYGDVLERDPDAIILDLRKALVSDWAARNVYHIAYDPQTMRVDYEKTKQLRDAERDERLKRGRPYDEFEREWLQKRPPEEALKLYGPWPYALQV